MEQGIVNKKCTICEFLSLIKWFIEHRKEVEQFMSQVQFTLSLVVNPVGSSLAITPTSGSASFTQGVAGSSTLGAVSGGVPPYTPSVDASSPSQLPTGLALSMDSNNNLVLSGTPTASGSGTVLIDVNDTAGNTAQLKHLVTPVGSVSSR